MRRNMRRGAGPPIMAGPAARLKLKLMASQTKFLFKTLSMRDGMSPVPHISFLKGNEIPIQKP